MDKQFRGAVYSKTVWLGLLFVVSAFFQANLPLFKVMLEHFVSPEHLELIFAGYQMLLGLLVVMARFLTDESLSTKADRMSQP